MSSEKVACSFSTYPVRYSSFEDLSKRDFSETRLQFVPVGSVEFTREYARCANLVIPKAMYYPEEVSSFFLRQMRETPFAEASVGKFVKPSQNVKAFPASIKKDASAEIDPYEPVWESEVVPFESEFRFYIQSTITKTEVLGWARYDELPIRNPEPDFEMVEKIAQIYRDLGPGPNAYSIDVGWRTDLERYCLVEVNDAWALGYYENSDPQSNPPSRQQYADMLVSRWLQILFCSIV